MEKKCKHKLKRKRQRGKSPEQTQLRSEIFTEIRKQTFGSKRVHGSQTSDNHHGGVLKGTGKYTKITHEKSVSGSYSNTEASASVSQTAGRRLESERQEGSPGSDSVCVKPKSKTNKKQKRHLKRKCTKMKSKVYCPTTSSQPSDSSREADWNLNRSKLISELGECESARERPAEHCQQGKQQRGDQGGAKHPRKQMDGHSDSQGGSRGDSRGGQRGHYQEGRRHDSQAHSRGGYHSRGAYHRGNMGAYHRGIMGDCQGDSRGYYEGNNRCGCQSYNCGSHPGRGYHTGSNKEDCQDRKNYTRKRGYRGNQEELDEGRLRGGDQGSNQGSFHNRNKRGSNRNARRGFGGRGMWSATTGRSSSSTSTNELQPEQSLSQSGSDPGEFCILW